MAKYLLKIRYTAEGLAAVLREGGSARRAAADSLLESVGGAMESFYFAFGEYDAYAICDVPDNTAAAAVAMAVSSSGRVSIQTVPLISVEEIDTVARGTSPSYRAPGT